MRQNCAKKHYFLLYQIFLNLQRTMDEQQIYQGDADCLDQIECYNILIIDTEVIFDRSI